MVMLYLEDQANCLMEKNLFFQSILKFMSQNDYKQ